MKKLISLFLVLIFAVAAFAGCAGAKTTISVKFVLYNGYDGDTQETIYEGTVELAGKEPSIYTVLDKLNQDKAITVEYKNEEDETLSLAAINEYKNEVDNTTSPQTIHQWSANVNNVEIEGLWADTIVKDGDSILFIHRVWQPEE